MVPKDHLWAEGENFAAVRSCESRFNLTSTLSLTQWDSETLCASNMRQYKVQRIASWGILAKLFKLNLFFLLFFFWLPLWHMEVPGPGTESEPELQPMLQLWQSQILNPRHQAGDQTGIPTEMSLINNLLPHSGNS